MMACDRCKTTKRPKRGWVVIEFEGVGKPELYLLCARCGTYVKFWLNWACKNREN